MIVPAHSGAFCSAKPTSEQAELAIKSKVDPVAFRPFVVDSWAVEAGVTALFTAGCTSSSSTFGVGTHTKRTLTDFGIPTTNLTWRTDD